MLINELPVNFISSTLNQLVKGYKWFTDGIRVKYIEFDNGIVFDGLGLAPINNPTFTGIVSGITKSMVGLENVDNTSDLNKPVSTATLAVIEDYYQAAIDESDVNDGLIWNNLATKAPIDNASLTGKLTVTRNGDGVEIVNIKQSRYPNDLMVIQSATASIPGSMVLNGNVVFNGDLNANSVTSNNINVQSGVINAFGSGSAGITNCTYERSFCSKDYSTSYLQNEIGYMCQSNKIGTVGYTNGVQYTAEIFQNVGSANDLYMPNGIYHIYIELYVYNSFEGWFLFNLRDAVSLIDTFVGMPYVCVNPREDSTVGGYIGDGAKFIFSTVIPYVSSSFKVRVRVDYKSHRSGTLNYQGCLFRARRIA